MSVEPEPVENRLERPGYMPPWGIAQLAEVGIVGLLPGFIPAGELLTVVDALLAAPILVAAVQLNGPRALDLIADLRARGEGLLLVGADAARPADADVPETRPADPVTPLELARAAGAHFFITSPAQTAVCRERRWPHIPLVRGLDEARAARRADYALLYAHLTPERLHAWREALHPTAFLVGGDAVTLETLPSYVHLGATAVAVPLWRRAGRPQGEIITRARRFTTVWQAVQKRKKQT